MYSYEPSGILRAVFLSSLYKNTRNLTLLEPAGMHSVHLTIRIEYATRTTRMVLDCPDKWK